MRPTTPSTDFHRVSPLFRSSKNRSSGNDEEEAAIRHRRRPSLSFFSPTRKIIISRFLSAISGIKQEEKGGIRRMRGWFGDASCSRGRKGEGWEKRGGKFYIRYSFASRYAFLPVFPRPMFANSAFAVSRVAEHPMMEELAWPNSVGQFPFGPFQPSPPFFLPLRRPSTPLPTRIGNQFRETVINGCEVVRGCYVASPFLRSVAIPLFPSPPFFPSPHVRLIRNHLPREQITHLCSSLVPSL